MARRLARLGARAPAGFRFRRSLSFDLFRERERRLARCGLFVRNRVRRARVVVNDAIDLGLRAFNLAELDVGREGGRGRCRLRGRRTALAVQVPVDAH